MSSSGSSGSRPARPATTGRWSERSARLGQSSVFVREYYTGLIAELQQVEATLKRNFCHGGEWRRQLEARAEKLDAETRYFQQWETEIERIRREAEDRARAARSSP